MAKEKPKSELLRLQQEQRKAREDEVFGGFSETEQAEYNEREERIRVLDGEIQTEERLKSAQAEQRRQWKKPPETDTHQDEAHQPYRSREKESKKHSADSVRRNRERRKNDSDKAS